VQILFSRPLPSVLSDAINAVNLFSGVLYLSMLVCKFLCSSFSHTQPSSDNCASIRMKANKSKHGLDLEGDIIYICSTAVDLNPITLVDSRRASKKRKASLTPDDPSLPPKKKAKPVAKVTKGRVKGPADYDRHCGVINDKGVPCSRSLTCKSHSMGAKRAVQGRSRNYDDLLLDWQRVHNPNFVEPVKRETKAEKKEKREREKLEKKRLADQAAAALGLDPAASSAKKSGLPGSSKKANKKATVRLPEDMGDDISEDLDHLDSEAEMDELVRVVRIATDIGLIGQPLAVPCDAGSWFVQRRERARCCRDLLLGALGTGNGTGLAGGIGGMGLSIGLAARTTNIGHGRLA
jgi:SAGA-associated factor 73